MDEELEHSVVRRSSRYPEVRGLKKVHPDSCWPCPDDRDAAARRTPGPRQLNSPEVVAKVEATAFQLPEPWALPNCGYGRTDVQ